MLSMIKNYEIGDNRKKDFKLLVILSALYCLIGLVIEIVDGWYTLDNYVTTLYSFSYFNDGFVRRAFVGTLYGILSKAAPFLMSYKALFYYSYICSFLFLAFLLAFINRIFNKITNKEVYKGAYIFVCFILAFLVPTCFCCEGLLGYADILQMSITLLQLYLLMERKWEWLVLPLTSINVLIHEGYLCMTFNVVVMALVYKAVKEEKNKTKYWFIFALNIVFMAVPAVISVFYTRPGNLENYQRTLAISQCLNSEGDVHYNLLSMMNNYHDNVITTNDYIFVSYQKNELPVFLVLFIPVFTLAFSFVKNLFASLKGKKKGLYITILVLGPALVAFEFYKYCDYGRYVTWLFFYYLISFLFTLWFNDKAIGDTFEAVSKTKNTRMMVMLFLAILYQPIGVTYFTHLSRSLLFRLFR